MSSSTPSANKEEILFEEIIKSVANLLIFPLVEPGDVRLWSLREMESALSIFLLQVPLGDLRV